MDLIEPVSAALPYHVSIGNHVGLEHLLPWLAYPLATPRACRPLQEYDYPASQDGSKDPSGAGAMWSPSWWNGGSDSGGECGMPTARRFRTPVRACIRSRKSRWPCIFCSSSFRLVCAGERQWCVLVQL